MSSSVFVKAIKPRNPFVVPAKFRQAGAHQSRKHRPEAQRALRRELERLHLSP